MTRPLTIVGISNTIVDLIELAEACGYQVDTIVTNTPEAIRPRTLPLAQRLDKVGLRPRVVSIDAYDPDPGVAHFIAPVAHKRAIADQLAQMKLSYATLIHPSASISRSATVGVGSSVGAGSVVASLVQIGDHVVVNRLVSIGHDTSIGSFSRLAPASNVAGQVTIGVDVTVGMGASILEELEIGEGAIVAAGAVVREDVAPFTLVAGVPANVKRARSHR